MSWEGALIIYLFIMKLVPRYTKKKNEKKTHLHIFPVN